QRVDVAAAAASRAARSPARHERRQRCRRAHRVRRNPEKEARRDSTVSRTGRDRGAMDTPTNNDDKIWIACIPKTDAPRPIGAQGIERCRACKCKIWGSPSTVEIILLQSKRAWPVCMNCFIEEVKSHPSGERFKIV